MTVLVECAQNGNYELRILKRIYDTQLKKKVEKKGLNGSLLVW